LKFKEFWKDTNSIRVNEENSRAYFTPFSTLDDAVSNHRFLSPYLHLLSGKWKFLYKDSVSKMPLFYKEGFDFSYFDEINVPSCWQILGYDKAQYQSSPYTFIFDPPNLPPKNPTGAYIKEFNINLNENKKYELHFEGKDSCIYVYLNGEFIGYGEVPHCDSFFDITKNLKNGKNRLCVMVLKRCTGTYLDDQDKIRLSGIFRDVYILERDKNAISDFFVSTKINGEINVKIDAKGDVKAYLYDENKNLLFKDNSKNITFKVKNPNLWTCETPYLYTLVLECENEFISQKIGIREVKITKDSLLLNNVPIKIRGINRHDWNPETGYVVTKEEIKKDLIMIKENNFNTIRTAHYPNMPEFYEFCDEIGLYVISEADMECHGGYYTEEFQSIVDNPLFKDAIIDRIMRMAKNFKNFSSIIMWSLGNESSWGENLLEGAKELKKFDTSRPVHYHGICMPSDKNYAEDDKEARKYIDLYSRMYTPTDQLYTFYDNIKIKQPLIMCEYSHAMGNSCGDLKTYEKLFDSDKHFIGGCIWEWCDHAIKLNGKKGEYLGYGGDFGDPINLKNVCMDGVVSTYRVPHSALYEAKAIFSPIKIFDFDKDKKEVIIENRNSFISLENYDFSFKVTSDGKEVEKGKFKLKTKPLSKEKVKLDFCGEGYDGIVYLSIKAQKNGICVTEKDFKLYEKINKEKREKSKITVFQKDDKIKIKTKNICYTFSTDEDIITSIKNDGREYLAKMPSFTAFRAPTDNDSYSMVEPMAQRWNNTKHFGKIEYATHIMKNIEIIKNKSNVIIKGDLIVAVEGRCHITDGKIEYKFNNDGSLLINHTGIFNKMLPYWLGRYGIEWKFKKEFENVNYLGLGPYECYKDKQSYALFGEYDYIIDNKDEMYEKPQECASRLHTRKLTLKDKDGYGFDIKGDFSFSATRYDIHEKTLARHQIELDKKNYLHLYTDYFMSGVGSRAVGGHVPQKEDRINAGDKIKFKLEFYPFKN